MAAILDVPTELTGRHAEQHLVEALLSRPPRQKPQHHAANLYSAASSSNPSANVSFRIAFSCLQLCIDLECHSPLSTVFFQVVAGGSFALLLFTEGHVSAVFGS